MLTGREARTFPPDVVRRLFWRIYATNLWDRDLVSVARTALPDDSPLQAKLARGEAAKALTAIEAELFPGDDD